MDALDYTTVITLIFVVGLLFRLSKLEDQLNRLLRVEQKIDLLLEQSGVEYNPFKNVPQEVLDALRKSRKIEAIKHYRAATGTGLKEAKLFVEELQRLDFDSR